MIKFFLLINMCIVDICVANSEEEAAKIFKEVGDIYTEEEAQSALELIAYECQYM